MRIERDEAGDRERDHRDRIDEPALFARRVDAGEAIEAALDRRAEPGERKLLSARVDARYVSRSREWRLPARARGRSRFATSRRGSWRHLRVRNLSKVRIFRGGSACTGGRPRGRVPTIRPMMGSIMAIFLTVGRKRRRKGPSGRRTESQGPNRQRQPWRGASNLTAGSCAGRRVSDQCGNGRRGIRKI